VSRLMNGQEKQSKLVKWVDGRVPGNEEEGKPSPA